MVHKLDTSKRCQSSAQIKAYLFLHKKDSNKHQILSLSARLKARGCPKNLYGHIVLIKIIIIKYRNNFFL